MALVGAEVKRKEDPRLITSTSAYVSDIAVPGLHHVAFVRSPHAHARIRSIDTAAAARLPGLRGVLAFARAYRVVKQRMVNRRLAGIPLDCALGGARSARSSGPSLT